MTISFGLFFYSIFKFHSFGGCDYGSSCMKTVFSYVFSYVTYITANNKPFKIEQNFSYFPQMYSLLPSVTYMSHSIIHCTMNAAEKNYVFY